MSKFVINNITLNLNIKDGVFIPTATTTNLINSVKKFVDRPGDLLDLGSGSGVVAIALSLDGIAKSPVYASDISKDAVKCVIDNCSKYNIPVKSKSGSLLEPWLDMKFDYIVDDISGISEEVAKLSPWFNGVSCASGIDGAYLTSKVLEDAKYYLKEGGLLFFPIISFSNVDKIIKKANKEFKNVKFLHREEWPLPKDMYKHIDTLEKLKSSNYIEYKNMFGMIICFTDIYVAFN